MIQILSKQVADKIAAGEVVERPLSIVKELVENAIDAGADAIVVEIQNGGKSYIRVTDNGRGISADEALLAFQRHATSKIKTDKDLESIETLGFRGEALASVAAVSRTEMITKTASEKTGTRVRIEGSEVVSHGSAGCPDGTTVVVTDLFYNTPARYKFLKSDAAESGLIIDLIEKMALAYANIRTRMINNGSVLFSTRGNGDRLAAILTVHSRGVADHLLPARAVRGDFKLEGYVSAKGYSKTNRRTQIYFVNGRAVSSKVMERGVAAAYADKLPEGRHPACFLFLSVSPDTLDVNIHPNKKEVRFDDERRVTDFIAESIQQALGVKEAIPEVTRGLFQLSGARSDDARRTSEERMDSDRRTIGAETDAPSRAAGFENEFLQEYDEQVDIKKLLSTIREEDREAETRERGGQGQETREGWLREDRAAYGQKPFDLTALTRIGSIFATYAVAADEDSLYLIDQHAAHERIFFERLMASYTNGEKEQQMILAPFVVEVSHSLKQDAFDWLDALCAAGFAIEEFGPKAFVVKAVPMFMSLAEAEAFVDYFLDNVREKDDLTDPTKIEKILSASCRRAVKANDRLSPEEIRQLLFDLANCANPYHCPHGRPTFIRLTKAEIEKMFKRK